MRYLITHPEHQPFFSQWFEYNNHYIEGMIIYDLMDKSYSKDGIIWIGIEIDHL